MKKDEIITLLAGQLEVANKRITELLNRINDLTACVRSLEQALLDKEESLEKQKNINRGLTRIASNSLMAGKMTQWMKRKSEAMWEMPIKPKRRTSEH